MTDVRNYLHAELMAFGDTLPESWSNRAVGAEETEFVATLPAGILEVGGQGQWLSVAFGSALWEDLPFQSVRDADRILAACDAIIAGRISEVSKGGLIKSVVTSLELSSRGFDERLDDHTSRLAGIEKDHDVNSKGRA